MEHRQELITELNNLRDTLPAVIARGLSNEILFATGRIAHIEFQLDLLNRRDQQGIQNLVAA